MRTATARATAVALVGGYLLGSIPVAVLVGRRHRMDPRTVGDANPGYWNVREQLGVRSAAPVFAGDVAKGVAAGAVGVGVAPAGAWGVGYAAVGGAMVGHAWPLFARFRGGRSILTWAGGICVLSPVAGLASVGAFVAVARAGSFAWGARLGVLAVPVLQLVTEGPHRTAATGALMSIIGLRFATAKWRRLRRITADDPAECRTAEQDQLAVEPPIRRRNPPVRWRNLRVRPALEEGEDGALGIGGHQNAE